MEQGEILMAEITRTKSSLPNEDSSGLDEFSDKTSNRVTKEVDPPIRPGWSRQQRPRSASATQVPRFAVPDDGEEVLIKFLDEMPFAPIYQHWLATANGRRAYTCLGFETCPLCARGDKAKASDWFNIVVLGDTPELKVWIASPDPSAAIEERATGKRTSPLNKQGLYFAVSKRKGSNGFFSYSVDAVREDELETDWGVKSLSEVQIAQFNKDKFDSSVVRMHTISELTEAARNYVDTE
jgi:hypothetical protein